MISAIQRDLVPFNEGNVEILWALPKGRKLKLALVVLIHGHHERGALIHSNFLRSPRRLDRWGGVALASVSQPGYGGSDGPPDYCGPKTQMAVEAALSHLRSTERFDPDRVALIGYSRGAIVASMIATRDKSLAAVVLGAGFYDFRNYYLNAPNGIKRAIENEAGLSETAFYERSAAAHVSKIESPLLIIHGALDERGGAPDAQKLYSLVRAREVPSKLHIYKEYGHHIPFRVFFRETVSFLSEYL